MVRVALIFCACVICPPGGPCLAALSSEALRQQVEVIAAKAQGRVGVAARIVETDDTFTRDGDGHYPMQSVYKLPIALAMLHAVDVGDLDLAQPVAFEPDEFISRQQHSPLRDRYPDGVTLSLEEIGWRAVGESDGTASDVLLRVIGGPGRVMEHLHGLGIEGIQVVDTEKAIGSDDRVQYLNWATPLQSVALLVSLHEGRSLKPESQRLLLSWMTETETGGRRLKGSLPPGTRVAHKTGSSGTVGGVAAATNDIGLIALPDGRTLALAVFVADSRATYDSREQVIAEVARAIWYEAAGAAN